MAPRLSVVALLVAAVGVVPLIVIGGTAIGVVIGAMWASAAWAVGFFVVQASGAAPRLVGGDAELWTADELAQLPDVWWSRHNVMLLDREGDVDHVVGGPAGVFALETKWTASRSPGRLLRVAAAQARFNAEKVRSRLRAGGVVIEVTPVVVVWSRHASKRLEIEGVTVVRGSELREWLGGRADKLAQPESESAAEALEAYLSIRRDDVTVSRFEDAGLGGVLADVLTSVVAGFSSIYVIAVVLAATSWAFGAATAVLLIAGGLVLRRRLQRAAPHAAGVIAGATGVLVLIVVLIALEST